MKVLIILTSHNTFGNTGNLTGFWLEELASPYYIFAAAGADITLASPKGGKSPIDPTSTQPDNMTEASSRFLEDADALRLLNDTITLEMVRPEEYDAVFYPGGHGPLWDLSSNTVSQHLLNHFHDQNKPVAAVCHGIAALLDAKSTEGTYLISDVRITGFTDEEEEQAGATAYVPFSIEKKAIENGAHFQKAPSWSSFAIADGIWITGQNPQSSEEVANLLIQNLQP